MGTYTPNFDKTFYTTSTQTPKIKKYPQHILFVVGNMY